MSDEAITTYVVYEEPGTNSEAFIRYVAVRNPKREAARAPIGFHSFFYFDILSSLISNNPGSIYKGHNTDISNTYYIDCTLYTRGQLPTGTSDYIVHQMENSGWKQMVVCINGVCMPFDPAKYELISTR